jgi:Na+/melibiose symporter-like transporter
MKNKAFLWTYIIFFILNIVVVFLINLLGISNTAAWFFYVWIVISLIGLVFNLINYFRDKYIIGPIIESSPKTKKFLSSIFAQHILFGGKSKEDYKKDVRIYYRKARIALILVAYIIVGDVINIYENALAGFIYIIANLLIIGGLARFIYNRVL